MNKLTEIANKNKTDKGTEFFEKHGYTEEYGKNIPEIGEYNLLEIGIWHGDSLRMWNEYNPELVIDSIDLDPKVLDYIQPSKNINIFLGNQTDEVFLKAIVENKVYDFIIDDGSHNRADIVASFKILYPYVKLGGYYYIEDLHAGQAEHDNTIKEIIDFIRDNKLNFLCKLECNGKLLIIQRDTSNH